MKAYVFDTIGLLLLMASIYGWCLFAEAVMTKGF